MIKKSRKRISSFWKKKSNIFLMIIALASLFLGIGYAEISEVDLSLEGTSLLSVEKSVIITDVSYVSSINTDYELCTINDSYLTLLNSSITLGNNLSSTITYKITVRNNSNVKATYNEAVYSTELGYDNQDIEFVLNGIQFKDELQPKESKEFTITFKYKDSLDTIMNNTLNSLINFKFDIDNKTAKIGEDYYDTLQEAIDAVPKNKTETTVELLKDTSETITINKNHVINLILHNNTISNSSNTAVLSNEGTLKIFDGTIISSAATTAAINNQSTGNITLENVTIKATGGRQALYNNKGIATIKGNSYLSATTTERSTVQNLVSGTLTIISGKIVSTGTSAITNAGTMTIGIKDGNTDETTPIIQGILYGVNSTNNTQYNFYNGTIKGKAQAVNNGSLITDIETGYNIASSEEEIDGILYKTTFLAITKTVTFNASGGNTPETTRKVAVNKKIGTLPIPTKLGYQFDGWYTESLGGEEISANTNIIDDITIYAHWAKMNSAEINGTLYGTLQEAINDVPTNNTKTTIKLLRDISENVIVQNNQTIEFDLQEYTIRNINNNSLIDNSGTIYLSNGVLTSNGTAATIDNNPTGKVIITGGRLLSTGSRQALYNYAGGVVEISGNAYISSTAIATATGSSLERGTIQNLSGGIISITGGTIIGINQQAISNEGTLTIGTKNGTINPSIPSIQGETVGIKSTGILNFYDGMVKGISSPPISGNIDDMENNAQLLNGTQTINDKVYHTYYLSE